jgi:hypothetical protein
MSVISTDKNVIPMESIFNVKHLFGSTNLQNTSNLNKYKMHASQFLIKYKSFLQPMKSPIT